MSNRPSHPGRRSIRLPGFDYARPGAYFVTLCTARREHLFATVVGRQLRLTPIGKSVEQCWHAIPDHFPDVHLDAFVVMPHHIHGIIWILDHGAGNPPPLPPYHWQPTSFRSPSRSIGSIVRGFKVGVTNWARANTLTHEVWQRNYYERVIRDDCALHAVRRYIANNPRKWIDRSR